MSSKSASRIRLACSAAAIPTLAVFILPLAIYLSNLQSVSVPKSAILIGAAALVPISAALISLLFSIPHIGPVALRASHVLCLAFFVLILFPNNTGQLTGLSNRVDHHFELLSIAKLVGVLVCFGILAWRRPGTARTLANWTTATGAFLALIACTMLSSNNDLARKSRANLDRDLLRLGQGQNVIILGLDAFTGYRMTEVLRERPDLANDFSGFTIYPNAIASALNSPAGTSALLTGTLDHASEIDDSIDRTAVSIQHSYLADAVKKGWDPTYISELWAPTLPTKSASEQSFIANGAFSVADNIRDYCTFLKVSAFRVLPQPLAKQAGAVFDITTQPLLRRLTNASFGDSASQFTQQMPLIGKMALRHVIANLFVEGPKPRVMFFLSKVSHFPWVMDDNGNCTAAADWASSSRFAAAQAGLFVRRLKELGAFDSSLVILAADHGSIPVMDPTMGRSGANVHILPTEFNALVMVKPPHAHAPIRISKMPVWIGDVAATVRAAMALPPLPPSPYGTRSLLDPDDENRRLNIPIYFRPESCNYHGPLKEWIRKDIVGGFDDYAALAEEIPADLLDQPIEISLDAGNDPLLDSLIARGGLPPDADTRRAAISHDARTIGRVDHSGVVVLSDESGSAHLTRFATPEEAVNYILSSPPTRKIFAAGTQVDAAIVRQLQSIEPDLAHDRAKLNFVFARTRPEDAPTFSVSTDNAHLTCPVRAKHD